MRLRSGKGFASTSAAFLEKADALVLSHLCTFLASASLQAVALVHRSFREAAARELEQKAVGMLLDADGAVRLGAISRLSELAVPRRAAHASAVVELLEDRSNDVYMEACRFLRQLPEGELRSHSGRMMQMIEKASRGPDYNHILSTFGSDKNLPARPPSSTTRRSW
jgi:hypothetical protein